MAGNRKIQAKQIDIASIEKIFDTDYVRKVEIVEEVEDLTKAPELPVASKVVATVIQQKADSDHTHTTSEIEGIEDVISDHEHEISAIDGLNAMLTSIDVKVNEKASSKDPTFTGIVTLPAINSESGDNLRAATVGYVNDQIANLSVIDGGEI